MDTQGEINSNFGAIEDEERRLAALARQIEDPDGPQADLTYHGLTFLQRIYDSQEDQMAGKMNPVGLHQFRFHRRALKAKYKAWKPVRSQLPPQYMSGLQAIQLNNPDLYSSPQEIHDNCMMLGAEQILNAYKPENRPLGWHLDPKSVAALDSFKAEIAYMEQITMFHHTCSQAMEQLDLMTNQSIYEETRNGVVDSLMHLANEFADADPARGKSYYRILEEFVDKESVLAHKNRVKQRKFRASRTGEVDQPVTLKLVNETYSVE